MEKIGINKKIKSTETYHKELVKEQIDKINAMFNAGDVCVVETENNRNLCGFFVEANYDDCDEEIGVVTISDRQNTKKNDKRFIMHDATAIGDIISVAKYT